MSKTSVLLVFCVGCLSHAIAQNKSPDPAQEDFARRAREFAEQERLKVEPQVVTPPRPVQSEQMPWRPDIVTAVFWVGEGGKDKSAWDPKWKIHYGGTDDPDALKRHDYIPRAFVPRLNPFYCALPYSDVAHGQFRPEAGLVVPWFKKSFQERGKSVCQNHWVAIRKKELSGQGGLERTCYAQWTDCGPFPANYFQYVFGHERPRPNANHGAGLNVSPAVRDFLGLSASDLTDWRFVEVRDIPPGPWRNYGENNHFVLARRNAAIVAPDFLTFDELHRTSTARQMGFEIVDQELDRGLCRSGSARLERAGCCISGDELLNLITPRYPLAAFARSHRFCAFLPFGRQPLGYSKIEPEKY